MDNARARGKLRTLIVAFAVAMVAFGIAARVVALGAPLFWQDEAYTALRVTGHLQDDYIRLFDGRLRTVEDVRGFERLESGRGVPAVVTALALEDPHHSPLFYVLDRLWVGAFGTSAGGFRGLSVALGIAAIGLAFALATTVTRSRIAGAITASLFALSPIFVVYARQAREYALLSCAIMLATLALVRALRTGGLGGWVAYAASVALGFYVDPIFALVVAAHAITTLAQPGDRSRRLRGFLPWLAAVAGGGLAFSPWALNAIASRGSISDQLEWGFSAYPLKAFAEKWTFNVGALFFDGEFRTLALAPLAIAVVVTVLALVILFVRRGERAVILVIAPLGAVAFAVLVGRDVLFHSHFSVIARYLTPLWLATIFACGAVIARGLESAPSRRLAAGTWLALSCVGIASAMLRGPAENWWDNNDQIAYQAVARAIDRQPHPLVVTERHPHVALVLARYLAPADDIVMFARPVPALPAGRDAFLVEPTPEILAAFRRRGYDVTNVSPTGRTIIASFHRDSLRASAVKLRDPQNALWVLRRAR